MRKWMIGSIVLMVSLLVGCNGQDTTSVHVEVPIEEGKVTQHDERINEQSQEDSVEEDNQQKVQMTYENREIAKTKSIITNDIPIVTVVSRPYPLYLEGSSIRYLGQDKLELEGLDVGFQYNPSTGLIYSTAEQGMIFYPSSKEPIQQFGQPYIEYARCEVTSDGQILIDFVTPDASDNWILYVERQGYDKLKVADNLKDYKLCESEQVVYYLGNDLKLYQYDVANEQSTELMDGVDEIKIDSTYDVLMVKTVNSEIYMYINGEAIKLVENVDNLDFVQLIEGNRVMYCKDIIDNGTSARIVPDIRGELFIKEIGEDAQEKKIASQVSQAVYSEGTVYYVNSMNGLCKKPLTSNKSEVISDNAAVFNIEESQIIYYTFSGELCIYENGESSILTDQIDAEAAFKSLEIIEGNDIVYLDNNFNLYVNEAIIEGVKSMAYYPGVIAYINKANELYMLDTATGSKDMLLDNAQEYEEIYLGGQLLYERYYDEYYQEEIEDVNDETDSMGYTKEEVSGILEELEKGALYDDNTEDKTINGEYCYAGSIVYGSGLRVRVYWVGSETLTMYNYDEEPKGTIHDIQDFDLDF